MCFKYFLFSSILFSLVCCSKQPQTKQIVIYGVVQAGKVSGANIAAYSVENGNRGKLIGETKSNESGNYSLSLPSGTGPIEVVASQGSFKDESTGLIISLSSSDEITAIVDSGTKDQATPITPFTTLVHDRVLVQLKQGNVTQDQFSTSKNAAETEVAQLFGVEPNLITTLPSDPESPGNPNDPEAKSAYLLTLFSQMTKDLGLGPDNSVHPASVLRDISRDFSNDENLNGQDMGTPISEATSKLSGNWTQSLTQSAENLQTNPKTSSFSEFNKDSILTQNQTNYPEDKMSETSSLGQVQVTIRVALATGPALGYWNRHLVQPGLK